jgi:hypothetical protein
MSQEVGRQTQDGSTFVLGPREYRVVMAKRRALASAHAFAHGIRARLARNGIRDRT